MSAGWAVHMRKTPLSDRLLELVGGLKEDWDGYGAHPPTHKAIEAAKAFVTIATADWYLYPTPEGGFQFECRETEPGRKTIYTEIVIDPDGSSHVETTEV